MQLQARYHMPQKVARRGIGNPSGPGASVIRANGRRDWHRRDQPGHTPLPFVLSVMFYSGTGLDAREMQLVGTTAGAGHVSSGKIVAPLMRPLPR